MSVAGVLQHAFLITAFVGVMMVAVEYLNVLTRGAWPRILASSAWVQYPVAVLLGATPGCLGAFAVVALYSHRMLSFGALVGCMIATSGDEAFVMLALFPVKAVILMLGLAAIGLATAIVTDLVLRTRPSQAAYDEYALHPVQDCNCFPKGMILDQLRRLTPTRGILGTAIGFFILSILTGQAGPPDWTWVRWTLILVGGFGMFVALTVPDHFLEEHLWKHVALRHVPRVFVWTLGALAVIALLDKSLPGMTLGAQGRWFALGAAALLGLIPESGPHLLFVTMYAQGALALGVLVASSIVQDGHGMLPLLAHSRLDFLKVKAINLAVGLLAGALLLALGW